jgi:hypothetical protein
MPRSLLPSRTIDFEAWIKILPALPFPRELTRSSAPRMNYAEIKIVDPGRGHQGKFNRAMETLGYESTMEVSKLDDIQGAPYHGKIFTYQR